MKPLVFVLLTLLALLIFVVLFLPGFPFGREFRTVNPNVTFP